MNVLDLFSGIGGFSLGLERAGMRTVAFCECDPFCRAVLAQHWPGIPIYGDVRELTAERLAADGIVVDVICGGFPCQDISVAGKGAGIDGERSGLWSEYARIIGEVRPRYVIVENVAALLGRGLARVLGDLAALGFDAEWHCIPASAVGAPHRRDRVWIVAHSRCWEQSECGDSDEMRAERDGSAESTSQVGGPSRVVADADLKGLAIGSGALAEWSYAATGGTDWWATEPDVGRVAHGVPARVDRLRSLGNAVVPQIPEIIGRALMGGVFRWG
jgi:DNA (cytosine-5)-methyltransferase 1